MPVKCRDPHGRTRARALAQARAPGELEENRRRKSFLSASFGVEPVCLVIRRMQAGIARWRVPVSEILDCCVAFPSDSLHAR